MSALIRWFLHNAVAGNLLMAALVAAGVAAAFNLTVRTFPEIATGAVSVTVAYPGASPTEVADAILTPIEEQLQGLEGVRELQSTARRGVGVVTAELTSGADTGAVKDDIETNVARITTFPDAALQPRIAEVEPTELAIELVLYGDSIRATLKALAQQVRRDLTDRQGISQVEISGVPTDQIDITVPRHSLTDYRIGLTDLADRIRGGNLDLTAGRLDTGQSDFQLRVLGEAQTADAFRDKLLFAGDTGAQVRLGDIAQVTDGFAESNVTASVSGQPAVFVAVNRVGTEQVLDIVDQVQSYLDTELAHSLPPGVTAVVWENSGEQLQGRIDLLVKNGAIGAALIFTVLLLFLDLRIAAWVAAGVVVTFAGVFAPMQLFGTTINQLSLFGFILALGIVVDDAIVVGENVYSELEKDSARADQAAERGILRVWRPILFSVMTTILAFVPLLFLPSSSGSFIGPVAAVVIYVLALSLVESFLILPKHLSHIRLGDPRRYSPRRATEALRRRVDAGFRHFTDGPLRRVVRGAIRHPVFVVVVCVSAAVMSAALVAGGVTRFVFFPSIEGNLVTAELRMPEGTSEAETLARAHPVAGGTRGGRRDRRGGRAARHRDRHRFRRRRRRPGRGRSHRRGHRHRDRATGRRKHARAPGPG
ncbi:MAG TPA: AcrB/AcrD/AcrF family protein, partial [Rhodobacteraceae bacterium]|nr:AcrB/AcrD/AcrF family protein [Paracoccaceae bacterium]